MSEIGKSSRLEIRAIKLRKGKASKCVTRRCRGDARQGPNRHPEYNGQTDELYSKDYSFLRRLWSFAQKHIVLSLEESGYVVEFLQRRMRCLVLVL
jgi:hypothetical protein